MYGGIEAGGTKFVCAVSEDGEILEKTSIPTTQHQKKHWIKYLNFLIVMN